MKYSFDDKEHLIDFICTEIITTAEATSILNCSRQYLDELVSKGKITPIKTINRVRLYWKNDIMTLLNKKNATEKS
ncbi:helix-turn-helix transcriptional regulator [Cellulosilyticum sp. I15G10I2]|uniref:helix-turn-helix transcriptional regulator n=1 Tax=Cellulosilyticum sp. I15G10I2 TaxID=1892843 RepID=UPI00085BC7F6|nr:helix-turn-helix domain-containing protein [Cellulosilyticum sp. I15G10I2]